MVDLTTNSAEPLPQAERIIVVSGAGGGMGTA
jgi:hypothetical protein